MSISKMGSRGGCERGSVSSGSAVTGQTRAAVKAVTALPATRAATRSAVSVACDGGRSATRGQVRATYGKK